LKINLQNAGVMSIISRIMTGTFKIVIKIRKVSLNDGEVEYYEFWNVDDIKNMKDKDIKPDSITLLDFVLQQVGGVDKL